MTFLSEAVRVLTSGSRDRSSVLRGSAEGDSNGGGAPGIGVDGGGAEGVLQELHSVLAEEMALSVAALRQEEEKAAAAATAATAGAGNVRFVLFENDVR